MASVALKEERIERAVLLQKEVQKYKKIEAERQMKRRLRLIESKIDGLMWIHEPLRLRQCFRKARKCTSDEIKRMVFVEAPKAKRFLQQRKTKGHASACTIQARVRRFIVTKRIARTQALSAIDSPRTKERRFAAEEDRFKAKLKRANQSEVNNREPENDLFALAYLVDLIEKMQTIADEGSLAFVRPAIQPNDGRLKLSLVEDIVDQHRSERKAARTAATRALKAQAPDIQSKEHWYTLTVSTCFDPYTDVQPNEDETTISSTVSLAQEEANCELRSHQYALESSLPAATALCVLLASDSSFRSFEDARDLDPKNTLLPLPLHFRPKLPLGSKRILCFLDARDGLLVAASSTQQWLDPNAMDNALVHCLLNAFSAEANFKMEECNKYKDYDLLLVETYYFDHTLHQIQLEPFRCADRDISVSRGLFSFDDLQALVSAHQCEEAAKWRQEPPSLLVYTCSNAGRRFEYRVRELRPGAPVPRKEELVSSSRGTLDLVVDTNNSASFSVDDDASSIASAGSAAASSVVSSSTVHTRKKKEPPRQEEQQKRRGRAAAASPTKNCKKNIPVSQLEHVPSFRDDTF